MTLEELPYYLCASVSLKMRRTCPWDHFHSSVDFETQCNEHVSDCSACSVNVRYRDEAVIKPLLAYDRDPSGLNS